MFKNELQQFMEDSILSVGKVVFKKYFQFDIVQVEPNNTSWCIIACEHNSGIPIIPDTDIVTIIGEPFFISSEVDLGELLSFITTDGWSAKIQTYYYEY